MSHQVGSVPVSGDDFAEAFGMRHARVVITARSPRWARIAAREATGFASSIIACDVEAGIEQELDPSVTPDGRPGIAILLFGFSVEALEKALQNRIGQCVLTCPTTAVFDGSETITGDRTERDPDPDPRTIALGEKLRYFGDGHQRSKLIEGRRYWRIPVMEGEFLIEESTRVARGIAGGNFLIQARDPSAGIEAAERAIEAIDPLPGVITPFPGGLARSGSKVGSRYPGLRASTNDAFCPTLKSRVETALDPETGCVYEVIVNGTSFESIRRALAAGIHAACEGAREGELLRISAGNYGGNLGKFHFHLHEVLS